MRARVALALLAVVVLGATLALAQGRRFGGLETLRPQGRPNPNVPYDGRFTFVRVNYTSMPGGYWYRGQPAWSHGYPTAERNLLRIIFTSSSGILISRSAEANFRFNKLYNSR